MIKSVLSVLGASALTAALALFGADPTPEKPVTQVNPTIASSVNPDVASGNNHGFLIVCNNNPQKFIVLDNDGNWTPDVREAVIKLKIADDASMECVSFVGLIEPSNPKRVSWHLLEMKSVSDEEFQQMIDGLQADRGFLKK